jgi:hypothetical protein
MKTNYTPRQNRSIFLSAALSLAITAGKAQQLIINERSYLVMNGNVSLVVNNATLKNNGNFTAGTGVVKFSGNGDSIVSKLEGSAATKFYDLTVSKAANGIALKSTASVKNTLTMQGGNLYTNNKLTLLSDSGATARVAPITAGSIIGKATIQRYIPARRAWRMLTAPVASSNTIFESWQNGGVYQPGINTFVTGPNPSSANGLDASPQNNSSMKIWNSATQAYNSVLNTNAPISGGANGSAANTAYFMFVRGDRNTSNFSTTTCNATTLSSNGAIQQGTQTFPVAAANGAYTFVGNPYASPINFSNVTRNNVVNRFYVWDPNLNSLGGYVMLDDLNNTGSYTKSVSRSNQTKELQSGQAFLVQTLSAGNASIVFNETNKSTASSNTVFRPTENVSQKITIDLDILQNDGTVVAADGTFAEFNDDFSIAVDYADALKFGNLNENLGLVRNNIMLTAERRPLVNGLDTLFLKLTKTNIGYNYQFTINPTNFEGNNIVLVDNYTGANTYIPASGTTTYSFSVDANTASAATNRFFIALNNFNVLPVTLASVKAAAQNNDIAIDWRVENEISIEKYAIEKSANGSDFTTVANVTAKNGSTYNNYSWLDVTAYAGANFYRIKVYEKNGSVKYSAVVKVMMTKKAASAMSIFPNPVTNSLINLQLANQAGGMYKLTLTNTLGQVLYTGSEVWNGTNGTLQVSVPAKLTTGMYQLEVINPANERKVLQVIAE